jgi:hypothetical protein
MKRDVAKWQNSPGAFLSPPNGPVDADVSKDDGHLTGHENGHEKRESIDGIPLLDETTQNGKGDSEVRATGAELLNDANGSVMDRRPGEKVENVDSSSGLSQ